MNHLELAVLRTEANELAFDTYNRCRELLGFVMPISPELKLDWSQYRNRSNARAKIISIGMRRYTMPAWHNDHWSKPFNKKRFGSLMNDPFVMLEYRRFQYNPEIGSFTSDTFHAGLVATIAHEFAHAVVSNAKYASMTRYRYAAPHGKEWQDLYRILRLSLVNDEYEIRKVTP